MTIPQFVTIMVSVILGLVFMYNLGFYIWYQNRNKKLAELANEFNLNYESKFGAKAFFILFWPFATIPISQLSGKVGDHDIVIKDILGWFRFTSNSVDGSKALEANIPWFLFGHLMSLERLRTELSRLKEGKANLIEVKQWSRKEWIIATVVAAAIIIVIGFFSN